MVTIKDIARDTGFSIATVSMALNDKKGISLKTRNKVLKVAEAMQYVPSTAAQVLKTKKSHTLGLIIGQINNPFCIDIMDAVEKIARQHGYNIFICNAAMSCDKAIECLRALKARDVDGAVISLSIYPTPAYIQEVHNMVKSGMKIVSLSQTLEGCGVPMVAFSVTEQLTQMITRLIALGHKHIGMLAAPQGAWMNNRLDVFRNVTQEYGLWHEDYIVYSDFDMYTAKKDALVLLQKHPELTAIVGVNDMVALGVLQAADQLGIQVPGELSIVGTDGIPYVNFTSPNIATVVVPCYSIGRLGTKKLIDLIEGRVEDDEFLFLPCTCSEGGSVARPPSVKKGLSHEPKT